MTEKMIVRSLGRSKKFKEDTAADILSLSVASTRLESAEKVVLRWDVPNSGFLPFDEEEDEGRDGAMEYLAAVDEILALVEDGSVGVGGEVRDRAETLVHIAMSRLGDEMLHVMEQNTVPLQSDRLYGSIQRFSSHMLGSDCGAEESESGSSPSSMSVESLRDIRLSLSLDVLSIDLISPEAVDDLKKIVDRMIRSGYGNECCQIYISVRREFLDDCLSLFGVDRMSIEDVQKEDWNTLDYMMKKWSKIVKVVVKVILLAEKQLCDFFFGDSGLIKDDCFADIAKVYVRHLLNFGEAVAIGHRSSEKLFTILDMYDALANVMPDLHALFQEEHRGGGGDLNPICYEAEGVLRELGDAAKCAFMEFENQVKSDLSSGKLIPGGEIHPKCRYVINYVMLAVEYSATLNVLLDDNGGGGGGEGVSHLGIRLQFLISYLESNLEEKSNLYEDIGLKYIFLMNNALYIIKKVKDSNLGSLMGDSWIRKRNGMIRQYSTGYLRASWTKILTCLRHDGLIISGRSTGSGSRSVSKAAVKERFKNFNLAYDEIYRIQCGWKVPDPQLREELMISISEMVIPAYRLFMGRFASHLEGERHAAKYIKYTPDDLESHLTDFFSGASASSNHLWRRHSSSS